MQRPAHMAHAAAHVAPLAHTHAFTRSPRYALCPEGVSVTQHDAQFCVALAPESSAPASSVPASALVARQYPPPPASEEALPVSHAYPHS